MTVKGKWMADFKHYRLIAILEVIERKDTHLQGKSWYTSRGLAVPSNCMVEDNQPHSFVETSGRYEKQRYMTRFLTYSTEKQTVIGDRIVKIWDKEYLEESKNGGHS